MKIQASIALLLTSFFSISAQDNFLMERYLATALNDQSIDQYLTQLHFLDENNFNSPWINRLEFRVGSEDANTSLNQYRIRLSPTNPAEIKANKLYYQQQLSLLNSQQQFAVNQALTDRYRTIIEFAYLLDLQHLLREKVTFQNLFIQGVTTGGGQNYSVKDLISVQADQTRLLLKLEETEMLISNFTYYIELDYGDFSDQNSPLRDLISIEQISNYTKEASKEVGTPNSEAESLMSELELSRIDLKVEKAESRSNIGYIQSNFDTDKGNTLSEHIGFQIGVRIPLTNPDKPSLNKKKIKLLEEEAKTESKLDRLQQKQELNEMALHRLISRFQLISERIRLSESIPRSLGSQVEWSQVLALKNYQMQLQEEKVETEKQIRQAYVDFLSGRGVLVKAPLLNYLSTNFTPVLP